MPSKRDKLSAPILPGGDDDEEEYISTAEADTALYGGVDGDLRVKHSLRVADAEGKELKWGRFKLSKTGLAVPPDVSKDEWLEFGQLLARLEGSLSFWVGDWANAHRDSWGSTYEEAIALSGLAYDTVRDYASVCRRLQYRYYNLTFKHHKIAASLPSEKQKYWLERAEKEGWSAAQLSREIKEASKQPSLPADVTNIAKQDVQRFQSSLKGIPDAKNKIAYLDEVQRWIDEQRSQIESSE